MSDPTTDELLAELDHRDAIARAAQQAEIDFPSVSADVYDAVLSNFRGYVATTDHVLKVNEVMRATVALVDRFGDYYCAVCENAGNDGIAQPYSDVRDLKTETCEHCRDAVQEYWQTKAALVAALSREET